MALAVSYLRLDYFLPVFMPSSGFPLLPTVPVGSLPTPLQSVYIPPTQTRFNGKLQRKCRAFPNQLLGIIHFTFFCMKTGT